ncbi:MULTISPECIES: DUF485 domain-containing protein [unclassified Haematospirillum]|uniref:DUF485 domain-containing protein n=1 Tax=unclassified Haematospirillum TaxID=2622088 RepID=UPI0014397B06|nr:MULTISPECIES: DUF485 domain-containing protein [unclassified Haematospirillum]NKD55306.1 DUF485 domain-containing protein [Haematospirillum sp. H4890]NKD75525.1 DUF485 domain-containing protein [Haematospirillum sp. H4485]NKD88391.1 DUF485 domain-containing protein [Haematospirillum sp. 15-248]
MSSTVYEKVRSNPKFHDLCTRRTRFAWILSVIMLAIYFGFIAVIAFSPSLFGIPISDKGITTIGIPIGIGVIVSAFVLTGIYVARANSEYDDLTRQIVEESR